MQPACYFRFGKIHIRLEIVNWSQMLGLSNAFTQSVLHDLIIYDIHAWYILIVHIETHTRYIYTTI